jgi:UDP-3-O-acyl-N-acetylglucosamine deacetylase
MATLTNIFIDQGSTFSTSVTIADSDGIAFDLTDYSAQAQIRKTYESITATNFSTTISVNPTTGLITLELTAAQTAALEPGRYVYDLIISSSGGIKTRVLEGIATVTPSVSRE